jgi:hypothetical protein
MCYGDSLCDCEESSKPEHRFCEECDNYMEVGTLENIIGPVGVPIGTKCPHCGAGYSSTF